MLAFLLKIIGNILLFPINIVLLPFRLIYKLAINYKAKFWFVV